VINNSGNWQTYRWESLTWLIRLNESNVKKSMSSKGCAVPKQTVAVGNWDTCTAVLRTYLKPLSISNAEETFRCTILLVKLRKWKRNYATIFTIKLLINLALYIIIQLKQSSLSVTSVAQQLLRHSTKYVSWNYIATCSTSSVLTHSSNFHIKAVLTETAITQWWNVYTGNEKTSKH